MGPMEPLRQTRPKPDETAPAPDASTPGAVEAPLPRGRLWLKLVPVAVIVAGLTLVFTTGLNRYLSLDALQAKRLILQAQVHAHPVLSLVAYIGAYVAVVGFSIPGALVMTLSGGFLFGPLVGTAAAVTGASTGATLMFLVARSALGDLLRGLAPRGGKFDQFQDGVRNNAFSYLLVLRLVPAVPFWLCNIASGFVRIPLSTYLCATVLGIIPSTVIYSNIGAGLGHVFDRGDAVDGRLLRDPQVLLPLIGLALLSSLPLIFHAWRARRRRREALANAAE